MVRVMPSQKLLHSHHPINIFSFGQQIFRHLDITCGPTQSTQIHDPLSKSLSLNAISQNKHFEYVWKHYIKHVIDENYDQIGVKTDPRIVYAIQNSLLYSSNVLDKIILNTIYISLNIGFMHMKNQKLQKTVHDYKEAFCMMSDKYYKLEELCYGPESNAGNASIKLSMEIEQTNMIKYYTMLNLNLGLYFYYNGYADNNINSNKYTFLKNFIQQNMNKIIDNVEYNYKYIQSKLIESIETDTPFNVLNILKYN